MCDIFRLNSVGSRFYEWFHPFTTATNRAGSLEVPSHADEIEWVGHKFRVVDDPREVYRLENKHGVSRYTMGQSSRTLDLVKVSDPYVGSPKNAESPGRFRTSTLIPPEAPTHSLSNRSIAGPTVVLGGSDNVPTKPMHERPAKERPVYKMQKQRTSAFSIFKKKNREYLERGEVRKARIGELMMMRDDDDDDDTRDDDAKDTTFLPPLTKNIFLGSSQELGLNDFTNMAIVRVHSGGATSRWIEEAHVKKCPDLHELRGELKMKVSGGLLSEYSILGNLIGRAPLLVVATGAGAGLVLDVMSFVRGRVGVEGISDENHIDIVFSTCCLPLLQFVTNSVLCGSVNNVSLTCALTRMGDIELDDKTGKGGGLEFSRINLDETVSSIKDDRQQVFFCGSGEVSKRLRVACGKRGLKFTGFSS